MTPTPVKRVRVTANWIQTVISPLPLKPSAELEQVLLLHNNRNIIDELISRANIVVTALFPTSRLEQRLITESLQNTNFMENLWSEQRRTEALKLYYGVLESICKSEAEKSNTRDLIGLLTNERFHRCMLACCAELVSTAHTGISTLIPVVFEITGITPFDLSKVIESVIMYEQTLPRELKRHLNSLEEQMLESRVWEKGSSLYNSLIVSRPDLSNEINRLGLLAEPMPPLDTISLQNPIPSSGFSYPTILQKHNLSPGNR